MGSRFLSVLRWSLMIWGGLCLALVLAAACYIYFPLSSSRENKAGLADVRFVLNWTGLGAARAVRVVQSLESAYSPTGDYLDAYAIKITHVKLPELLAMDEYGQRRWYRGDQLPPMLESAVEFATPGGEAPWFPKIEELRGPSMYVFPSSVTFEGTRPGAARLIFIRPADNMVFYFGTKT